MYFVNKLAWLLINPVALGAGFVFVAIGWELHKGDLKRCRLLLLGLLLGLSWMVLWSLPITGLIVARLAGLNGYLVVEDSRLPHADAIVVLGGGLAGERSMTGLRLWKSGLAPIVLVSGVGADLSDGQMMLDLGLSKEGFLAETNSRNTEENALFTERELLRVLGKTRARVLLVTSWRHMKRSMMIFHRCAPKLDCVPVVTKYDAVNWDEPIGWLDFDPGLSTLLANYSIVKEVIGVFWYKLRGF